MRIRIGTSGWVYNHWRGVFYPEDSKQRDWFDYYARQFETVEINNSFYRLPSPAAFDAWKEQAPADFIYAVKASRFLTHMKKLKDPQEPLKLFFERADRLDDRLGPVLYQLPPRWRVNLPRYERFLAALPAGYAHVIEFRDPSWLIEEVFQLMERFGVAHCIHDMRPLEIPLRATAALVYIRFHGVPVYSGNYLDKQLETWAGRIEEWRSQGHEIYAYFNNDAGGNAVRNALRLREMVGGGR